MESTQEIAAEQATITTEEPTTTGEAPVIETAPAETPPVAPEKDDKRLGRAFAQLSRKEQAIVAKERQLKSRMAELEAAEKTAKEYAELRDLIKKDPLSQLEKLGLTYEEIIKAGIANDRPPMESKIEALERKIAEKEAQEAKARDEYQKYQEQQAYQAQIARGVSLVDNFLKSKPDDYELSISKDDSREEILEVFYRTYDEYAKQDIQLSNEETEQLMKKTADEYEKFLQTKLEQQIDFMKKTKKFSNRFEIPKEINKEISPLDTQTHEIKSKTLTNNLTKSGVSRVPSYNYTNDDEVLAEMTRILRIQNGKEKG